VSADVCDRSRDVAANGAIFVDEVVGQQMQSHYAVDVAGDERVRARGPEQARVVLQAAPNGFELNVLQAADEGRRVANVELFERARDRLFSEHQRIAFRFEEPIVRREEIRNRGDDVSSSSDRGSLRDDVVAAIAQSLREPA
jgi:hypothetical protein